MSEWAGHWRDARAEAERRDVCSRLMKRHAGAAFERIPFDLNGYARDLAPAADAVWGACRLAVFPSSDFEVVRRTAKAMQVLLDASADPRLQRDLSLSRL